MAKKTKREIFEREVLVHFFKWEFVRRNGKFIEEISPLLNRVYNIPLDLNYIFKLSKNPNTSQKLILDYLKKCFKSYDSLNKIFTEYNAICNNWDILFSLDPSFSAIDFLSKTYNSKRCYFKYKKLHTLLFLATSRMIITFIDENAGFKKNKTFPVVMSTSLNQVNSITNNSFNVKIDLNTPRETIKASLDLLLDTLTKSKIQRRTDFKKYTEYLAVYDMKESGMDWFTIAENTYPVESPTEGASMEDNIRRQYGTCVSLINEDYRQIR